MKKVILLLAFFILSAHTTFADDEISVILNGEKLEFTQQSPIIVDNRTMVPMRAIFEALGADVVWNAETKTAQGTAPGVLVSMTIGENKMFHNTIPNDIDVPAQIINNSTMIPLRVVSEAFGVDVAWDASTKTITLTDAEKIKKLPWNDYCYYIGETENDVASGYGMLYDKDTNEVTNSGVFNDTSIVYGTRYFDNYRLFGSFVSGLASGECFVFWTDGDYEKRNYLDGSAEGPYQYWHVNGDYEEGDFVNDVLAGEYKYYFADGGYEVGEYINGIRESVATRFLADDSFACYVLYHGNKDVLHSKTMAGIEMKLQEIKDQETAAKNSEKIVELENQITVLNNQLFECNNAYFEEILELDEWYKQENEKYIDLLYNYNPYETDWVQSIYESFGVDPQLLSDSGKIDSFAAANAARQQQAAMNAANQAISESCQQRLQTIADNIENTYNTKKKLAEQTHDTMVSKIEWEIQQLQQQLDVLTKNS